MASPTKPTEAAMEAPKQAAEEQVVKEEPAIQVRKIEKLRWMGVNVNA